MFLLLLMFVLVGFDLRERIFDAYMMSLPFIMPTKGRVRNFFERIDLDIDGCTIYLVIYSRE